MSIKSDEKIFVERQLEAVEDRLYGKKFRELRLTNIIDKIHELPMAPIILTENSKAKSIRVIGIIIYVFWFLPAAVIWFFVAFILAIPAMIQDA